MTFRRHIRVSIAAMLMAASVSAHAQPTSTRFRSGYAPVNGLRMYYEIHGTGQPLILVHHLLCDCLIQMLHSCNNLPIPSVAPKCRGDDDQFSHDFRVLNGRSKRDFASNRVAHHVGFLESQILDQLGTIMTGRAKCRASRFPCCWCSAMQTQFVQPMPWSSSNCLAEARRMVAETDPVCPRHG